LLCNLFITRASGDQPQNFELARTQLGAGRRLVGALIQFTSRDLDSIRPDAFSCPDHSLTSRMAVLIQSRDFHRSRMLG
jgi:hypothetical protein